MAEITVQAEPREPGSSNVARRLRQERRLPAVVYGGEGDSVAITIDPKEIVSILKSESGQNTLFQLAVDGGQQETVMIFDVQVDPITHRLQHADLVRISMDRALQVEVPVEVVGVPAGVRDEGGILDHTLRELLVECLPGNIPDQLEIDVSELMIGDAVSVEDLDVPEEIKVLTDPKRNIASVVPPVSEEELEAAIEEVAGEPILVGEEEEELLAEEEEGVVPEEGEEEPSEEDEEEPSEEGGE